LSHSHLKHIQGTSIYRDWRMGESRGILDLCGLGSHVGGLTVTDFSRGINTSGEQSGSPSTIFQQPTRYMLSAEQQQLEIHSRSERAARKKDGCTESGHSAVLYQNSLNLVLGGVAGAFGAAVVYPVDFGKSLAQLLTRTALTF
jgi:hypothetical protein